MTSACITGGCQGPAARVLRKFATLKASCQLCGWWFRTIIELSEASTWCCGTHYSASKMLDLMISCSCYWLMNSGLQLIVNRSVTELRHLTIQWFRHSSGTNWSRSDLNKKLSMHWIHTDNRVIGSCYIFRRVQHSRPSFWWYTFAAYSLSPLPYRCKSDCRLEINRKRDTNIFRMRFLRCWHNLPLLQRLSSAVSKLSSLRATWRRPETCCTYNCAP